MKSMELKIVLMILILLLTTLSQILMGQTKGIVVDKVTRQPIPYASFYTKMAELF